MARGPSSAPCRAARWRRWPAAGRDRASNSQRTEGFGDFPQLLGVQSDRIRPGGRFPAHPLAVCRARSAPAPHRSPHPPLQPDPRLPAARPQAIAVRGCEPPRRHVYRPPGHHGDHRPAPAASSSISSRSKLGGIEPAPPRPQAGGASSGGPGPSPPAALSIDTWRIALPITRPHRRSAGRGLWRAVTSASGLLRLPPLAGPTLSAIPRPTRRGPASRRLAAQPLRVGDSSFRQQVVVEAGAEPDPHQRGEVSGGGRGWATGTGMAGVVGGPPSAAARSLPARRSHLTPSSLRAPPPGSRLSP